MKKKELAKQVDKWLAGIKEWQIPELCIVPSITLWREVEPFRGSAHILLPKRFRNRIAWVYTFDEEDLPIKKNGKLPRISKKKPTGWSETFLRDIKPFSSSAHINLPKRYIGKTVAIVIPDFKKSLKDYREFLIDYWSNPPFWKYPGYIAEEIKPA